MSSSNLSALVGQLPLPRSDCLCQTCALQPIESPAGAVLVDELSTREHLSTLLFSQTEGVSDGLAHLAHMGRCVELREMSQDWLDTLLIARDRHRVSVPSAFDVAR